MNLLQKFEYWGDRHHPKWLDVIRVALGIFLCYKGIDFLRNTSELISLMSNRSPFGSFLVILLAHYVTFAHILGGFLLTIGFLTRLSCVLQIPILVGALVLMNSTQDVVRPYSDVFLTAMVLLLLMYFLVIGNGSMSVKIPDEEKKRVNQ